MDAANNIRCYTWESLERKRYALSEIRTQLDRNGVLNCVLRTCELLSKTTSRSVQIYG